MVKPMSDSGQPTPDDWKQAAAGGAEHTTVSGSAPVTAAFAPELLQQVIDAARAGLPNEAVGLLIGPAYAAQEGRPTRFVPLTNAAASPYRYLLDPDEQLQVMLGLDDAGEVIWGIVHSHVASAAVPSATDVGLAFYPDSLYLICSLAEPVPVVRAWTIRDGEVSEVPVAIG